MSARGLFRSGVSAKELSGSAITKDTIASYLPTQRLSRNLKMRLQAIKNPEKLVAQEQEAIERVEIAVADKYETTYEAYSTAGFPPSECRKKAGLSAQREFEERMVLLEAQFPRILENLALKRIKGSEIYLKGLDAGAGAE